MKCTRARVYTYAQPQIGTAQKGPVCPACWVQERHNWLEVRIPSSVLFCILRLKKSVKVKKKEKATLLEKQAFANRHVGGAYPRVVGGV